MRHLLVVLAACAGPQTPRERAVTKVFELFHASSLDLATVQRVATDDTLFTTIALKTHGPCSAMLFPNPALGLHAADFTPRLHDARHSIDGTTAWFTVGDHAIGLETRASKLAMIELTCK